MTAQTITSPDATTGDAAIDAVLSQVADDSRVEDVSLLSRLADDATERMRALREQIGTVRGMSVEVARDLLSMAAITLRPNGFPDWSRYSDASTKVATLIKSRVFGEVMDDVSTDAWAAVRKAVERERPFFIASWVLDTDNSFSSLRKQAEKSPADRDAIVKNPTPELRDAVLVQIRSQIGDKGQRLLNDLKAGHPYAPEDAQSGGGGGGGGGGGKTAAEIVEQSAATLGNLTPRHAVASALLSLCAFAEKAAGSTGEVEKRQTVVNMLGNVGQIALLAAKQIEGNATDDDREKLLDLISKAEKQAKNAIK